MFYVCATRPVAYVRVCSCICISACVCACVCVCVGVCVRVCWRRDGFSDWRLSTAERWRWQMYFCKLGRDGGKGGLFYLIKYQRGGGVYAPKGTLAVSFIHIYIYVRAHSRAFDYDDKHPGRARVSAIILCALVLPAQTVNGNGVRIIINTSIYNRWYYFLSKPERNVRRLQSGTMTYADTGLQVREIVPQPRQCVETLNARTHIHCYSLVRSSSISLVF